MLRKRIPYFFCLVVWSLGTSSSLLCAAQDKQNDVRKPSYGDLQAWLYKQPELSNQAKPLTHDTVNAWLEKVKEKLQRKKLFENNSALLSCTAQSAPKTRDQILADALQLNLMGEELAHYNRALSLLFWEKARFVNNFKNKKPEEFTKPMLEDMYDAITAYVAEHSTIATIQDAIKKGLIEKVRILLKCGSFITQEENNGVSGSLLIDAVESPSMNDDQRTAMIKLLLESGFNQTLPNLSEQTALTLAAEKNSNASLCALLDDKNPAINADYLTQLKTKDGQTLLNVVAQRGSQKCIELLQRKGLNIELPKVEPTAQPQPKPVQPAQPAGQSPLPTTNPPVKQVTTASSQQEGSSASSTISHKNWAIGALSAVVVLGIVGWLVKKSQHNSAQNENDHGEVELS